MYEQTCVGGLEPGACRRRDKRAALQAVDKNGRAECLEASAACHVDPNIGATEENFRNRGYGESRVQTYAYILIAYAVHVMIPECMCTQIQKENVSDVLRPVAVEPLKTLKTLKCVYMCYVPSCCSVTLD
jgi:hypothetical protein